MSNILQAIENEQLRTDIPAFAQGDTVIVRVRVKEGDKERLQAFEGVVIASVTVVYTQTSQFVKCRAVKVLSVYSKHIAHL